MRERYILMSSPMVRAILANKKRLTSRLMNPQPVFGPSLSKSAMRIARPMHRGSYEFMGHGELPHPKIEISSKPYAFPGDILLVRENAWIWCDKREEGGKTVKGRQKYHYVPVGQHVVYQADGEKPVEPVDTVKGHCWRYKPGRFLPRWAIRIKCRVVGCRCEPVQDITEADALAEGFDAHACEQVFTLAAGKAKRVNGYYLCDDEKDWTSEDDWCEKCVEQEKRKHPKARLCTDGCSEKDSPGWCAKCGVLLDTSLTNYGVDTEMGVEEGGIEKQLWPRSDSDALIMERIAGNMGCYETDGQRRGRLAQIGFATIWDLLHGKTNPWRTNPWVYRIVFERFE